MLDFGNLVKSALTVAESVVPLIPYGKEADAAVEAVRDLFTETKAVVAADDAQVAALEEGRDQFEAAVNAHANSTAAKLGDDV